MPDTPEERARLVAGLASQLDALARRRARAQMPRPPPSPLHIARHRRARHWKTRMIVVQHLITLVAMLAVLAFILLGYRALSIYAARNGYRLSGDVARVGFALFLGGALTGAVAWNWWIGRGE